jgi:hypothetical protein
VHNGGGRDGNTGGASGGIIMLFAEGTITVNGKLMNQCRLAYLA